MLGLFAAIAAAVGFAVGAVLQKVGAPPEGTVGLRLLVHHLLTSRAYMAGTALDLLGFALTALAARQIPLFAVEGALSTSVGITAVLAAWKLGERLERPARVTVCLMVVGLVLLSVSAGPESTRSLDLSLPALAAAGLALLFLVAMVDGRVRSRLHGTALAAVAGVSFGTWAAVPRLTHDGVPANAVGALFVAVGLIAYGAALRRGSAVAVMAVTVAAESVLPALCGLLLGDHARPGMGGLALAGFTITVGGAILLAAVDRAERGPCAAFGVDRDAPIVEIV